MRTLVAQVQLPLHRKRWVREFALCLRLLCHLRDPRKRTSGDYFNSLLRSDKRSGHICAQNMQTFEHQILVSICCFEC
jgi:hypothetical protein